MGFYLVGDYVVNSSEVTYVSPVVVKSDGYVFCIFFTNKDYLVIDFPSKDKAIEEHNLFCRNIGTHR